MQGSNAPTTPKRALRRDLDASVERARAEVLGRYDDVADFNEASSFGPSPEFSGASRASLVDPADAPLHDHESLTQPPQNRF